MAHLFDQPTEGHIFFRISNPTVGFVEEKIAALEGGVGAHADHLRPGRLPSSPSSTSAEAGDRTSSAPTIYGGTINLFGVTLKKLGIDCTFVARGRGGGGDSETAFRPNTKCCFRRNARQPGAGRVSTSKSAPTSPTSTTFRSSWTTPSRRPILCRPFELGADIVTHSTTKYMDGHAVRGRRRDRRQRRVQLDKRQLPGVRRPDPPIMARSTPTTVRRPTSSSAACS